VGDKLLPDDSADNTIYDCQMEPINIRPGYLPYWLTAAVLMTAGSGLFKYGRPGLGVICWSLLIPVLVAAVLDRLEFDGLAISHLGPLAFVLSFLFRLPRQLRVS